MKTYITSITAIDPTDGHMKEWCGPVILAQSEQDAYDYCQSNGLGYCKVIGILIGVLPIGNDLEINSLCN